MSIVRDAENKRFGYITPAEGGSNLWFGESDIDDVSFQTLRKGDAVTYELGQNFPGSCARHVKRASPA